MRSFGKWLGRLLLTLIVFIAGVWLFAPEEPVARSGPFAGDLSDPVAHYAAREAAIEGITPGTEARIIWAGAEGERAPITLLYIHGFSATSEEIRPVPDLVAEALGANLVYPRLRGHGRNGDALAEATAGEWVDDTAEALAVARAVGDEIIILATSTGATLAALAMTEADMAEDVEAMVFVAPNFELANPAGRLLNWPLARVWVPWLVGAERSFATQNEDHARYWTWSYPTVAAIPVAALMSETVSREYSGVSVPVLAIFSDDDQVISAPAIRRFAEGWGGVFALAPQTLPETGADPYNHVIAGDILSPAMTAPITDQILTWLAETRP